MGDVVDPESHGDVMNASRIANGRPVGCGLLQPTFHPGSFGHIAHGLDATLSSLPDAPEGHISPLQAELLYHVVRVVRPSFVVETGFCVGHSAHVIIAAQQSIGLEPCLMSIDDCRYAETRPTADALRRTCPGFEFVEGDSRDVLAHAVSGFLRRRLDVTLGLAIVDGGHDAATAAHDLEVLLSLLAPGGLLWLDDYEKRVPCPGVNRAGWAFERQNGMGVRFRSDDHRGWMIYQKRT